MSEDERNQAEWDNPANWNYGLYRSPHDTRVWVAKRNGVGTTINFGHRHSLWATLGLLTVPIGLLIGLVIRQLAR